MNLARRTDRNVKQQFGGGCLLFLINWIFSIFRNKNIRKYNKQARGVEEYQSIMHDGTDAGAIEQTGVGTVVGGISVPTRYIHNAIEVADISDIEACIELIVNYACRL